MVVWCSQHFKLEEFTRSSTAERLGIENQPDRFQVENLNMLAVMILEKLRKFASKPVVVTSGFRCPALNKAVGGVANSYHLQGRAADLAVASRVEAEKWGRFLAPLNLCDLVVYEERPGSRWLHVQWSYSPRHRFTYDIRQ